MKDESNSVGEVVQIEAIDLYIQELIKEWDENKESVPWYKIWHKVSMSRVTNFLMNAIDDLICYVDDVVDKGADKKATVINAIEKLYDYVIREALPIWLKPFAGSVKNYIIHVLVSNAIDWMVDKYRNGSWRMNNNENRIQALWASTIAAGRVGK
jgi:hypothetical protein